MATLHNLRPATVIPQEICGLICQDTALAKSDLLTLCAVSHAFRDEAERLLYRSVELKEEAKIRLFCIAVTRRPSRLRGVRKLVFHLLPQQVIDPDDLSRLVKILRLSTNLKDLRMLGYSPTQSADAIHNWVLEGHYFKLATFTNSYFMQSRLKKFLESQSELETLILTRRTTTGLRGISIPSLKDLSCSESIVQELIDANCTMNLERLQITAEYKSWMHGTEEFFQRMKMRLGGKLKVLSIEKQGALGWNLSAIVSCVATHYPAIKYLEILDYETPTPVPYNHFSFPFNVKLTHIETLIVRPPMLLAVNGSTWPELHTDAGQLAIAKRFLDTFPTLKRLILVKDAYHPCEYKRISPPALDILEARDYLSFRFQDEWLNF